MFENISVKTALKLAFERKAVIYDIRDEEAYKRGHLPTAKHAPEEKLKAELERGLKIKLEEHWNPGRNEELEENQNPQWKKAWRADQKEKQKTDLNWKIILYCDYGNKSMRLAKELSEAGIRNLASIVGGYHAYEGYVEARKNDLWTMEWKERGIGSMYRVH